MRSERITKLMANRGLCSRREAERLIEAGQVLVDGVVVRGQGHKASPHAEITIAPGGVRVLRSLLTVLLHKPAGIVSTQPTRDQVPAWALLRVETVDGWIDPVMLRRVVTEPWSLSVAGRLDRASRGLLILTEDGAIARRIIGGHDIEKTYRVRAVETVTDRQIRRLRGKISLDGQLLLPMRVTRASTHTLRFVLREGRKHQIRRACRRVGLHVVDLFREAIGPLRIGKLPEGRWCPVSAAELAKLHSSTAQPDC